MVGLIAEIDIFAQPPGMDANIQPAYPTGDPVPSRFDRDCRAVEPKFASRRAHKFRAGSAAMGDLAVAESPRALKHPTAPPPVGNAKPVRRLSLLDRRVRQQIVS